MNLSPVLALALALSFAGPTATELAAQTPTRTDVHQVPYAGQVNGLLGSGRGTFVFQRDLVLAFPRFDPARGTLRAVRIAGSSRDTPSVEVVLAFGFNDLIRVDLFAFRELDLGRATNPNCTNHFNRSDTVGTQTHWDYLFPPQTQPFPPVSLAPAEFGPFLGTGTVDLPLTRRFEVRMDDNANRMQGWIWRDVVQTEFQIEYEYEPAGAVQTYGSGCHGWDGTVPAIGAVGAPLIGNAAFAVAVSSARPGVLASLQFSGTPGAIPLNAACTLWVGVPFLSLPAALVDAGGVATTPLPIPWDPLLLEAEAFLQYLVLDPGGSLPGLAAFSDALWLHVGV